MIIGSACGNNWISFNDKSCIKIITRWPMNRTLASSECQRLDARLLTINSRAKQFFITSNLIELQHRHFYIGLSKIKTNDSFKYSWDDGSEYHYNNFANQSNAECVALSSFPNLIGKWFNTECDQDYSFICEKEFCRF